MSKSWFLKVACVLMLATGGDALAIVKDIGLRSGAPGGGNPVEGLNPFEQALFDEGRGRVGELETTCATCAALASGTPTREDPLLATRTSATGLNARFNADQCIACHSQPAIGGSGGFLVPNPKDSVRRVPENPLFDLVPHRFGQTNKVPSFIKQFGPILVPRFVKKADGTPDGHIYPLYTIVGRTDDPTIPDCNAKVLPQPDFETELKKGNISFRAPLQLFGMGLIEAIPDAEILARHRAMAAYRGQNGIVGVPNGSVSYRFGWKAQHKALEQFTDATNEFAPQMKKIDPKCIGPETEERPALLGGAEFEAPSVDLINPLVLLATSFMRYLDAPRPAPMNALAQRGKTLFGSGPENPGIGCVACHTAQMTTSATAQAVALQKRTIELYSDLLLHRMGPGLADNITQGQAKGDMFRTPPLWGVGQRRFFLHDGRTDDLLQAIEAHAAPAGNGYPASEANAVITRFKLLPEADRQAILLFLRAL
jgi:mono/diheme cytochrome c family protein